MRVVILCGGSGSRLWPKSRASFPKQFIPLFESKSLLDLTIERILKIKFDKIPIFVCSKIHSFLVKQALKKYKLKAEIILEPEGKNTCAAIYLAAKYCSKDDELLIMPSDHLIPNIKKFVDDISDIKKNLVKNHWTIIGIKPTNPSESYGYIKVKKNNNEQFKKVLKFIEKPTKEKATQFIIGEDYYWNAGIFIGHASMIIKSIKKHAPSIASHCEKNFNNIRIDKKNNELNFSNSLFSEIPSNSIDYAVMENEKNIYLYPFNSEWHDLGSWDSISEIHKNKKFNEKVIQINSQNNFIYNDKRTIATIGVEDLIIVDSDNATLISKKQHSDKVRLVVDELSKRNLTEGKENTFEYRPWGKFENLFEDNRCKVKRIIVSPKKRLSLQYHNFRSEHWIVISGTANIHLDGNNSILLSGQSIDIPRKSPHYIENKQSEDLIIIETQLGSYFGEDDIIRLDDPYSR